MFQRLSIVLMFAAALPLYADEPDPSKARVEGVVVDEAGKPVAGATVSMVRYSPPESPATATTNADGTFRLISDSASVHHRILLASAGRGKRQGIWQVEGAAIDLVTKARIVIKPARTIGVRVVNDLKDPILSATVGLFLYTDTLPVLLQETDRQGMATIDYPADLRFEQVVALKAGIGFDYRDCPRSNSRAVTLPKEITLTLSNARTLRVHAQDSSGIPLAGVEFIPWIIKKKNRVGECNLSGAGMMRAATSKTDKDGVATFDWLPSDSGSITFCCRSPEYHEPKYTAVFSPDDSDKRLVSQLNRYQPTRLGGKVTRSDGAPGGGVLLDIAGQGPNFSYHRDLARTKSDGSWTHSVYPNHSYRIVVTDGDWAAKSRKDVKIKEGEQVTNIDFRLEKGTLIQGRVTAGKNKKPLANLPVFLHESSAHVRTAKCDADGKYSFRVVAGTYEIGIAPNREVIKVDQLPTMEKNFHLERPMGADLSGSVRTADGKPAVKANISCGTPSGGFVFPTAATDEQGKFVFRRRTVNMLIYVVNSENTQASAVVVDEDAETANFVLAPAGTIVGQILDKNKLPIAGVRVECVMTIGQGKDAKQIKLRTTPDALGNFRCAGIIDGSECQIVVVSGQQSQALKTVKVSADKVVNLGQVEFAK